jgi:GST-like protein
VDHDNNDLAVFETACMMRHRREGRQAVPTQEMNKKYDVVQWLMWQMGGLGPMHLLPHW